MRYVGCLAALVGLVAAEARADERKFTYSYEAKTLPEGVFEFEQWATLSARKEAGVYRVLALREEVEYGITDRLTTGFYLNWEYAAVRGIPDVENEHEVEFEGVSSEWKYKLTDAAADPIGSLLYGEASLGEDEYELEAKLILNKVAGPWNVAYNFIFEWEREDEEDEGWESEFVISNTIGVSYALGSGAAVGIEALNHMDFEHSVSHSEHNAYFIGPNVHYAADRWWATLTLLKQVGDRELDDHEKYEARLIVGVNF